MLSAVQRGVVDLIGAARPSIADPFLPRKIQEGHFKDIRECIGCNICVTGDTKMAPIRCTQNPTMGETWRRGWHPERIAPLQREGEVLVVGAGPAGLECARALGQRGCTVVLAEARRQLGGRVIFESQLPGLAAWRRVIDWRLTQIEKMANVAVYPGSEMTAVDILESGITHIILATGAAWRRDGIGRQQWQPIPGHDQAHVYTPDDIFAGHKPCGRIVVYDNDHYYLGGLLAEQLIRQGHEVLLVTPAPLVSIWTQYTLEQEKIQDRLMALGVALHSQQKLVAINAGAVTLAHVISGTQQELAADAVILLADRLPNEDASARTSLHQALKPLQQSGDIQTLQVIGDAEAPSIIERAVFAGHRAAREFGEAPLAGTPFKVERVRW
jgi:dimethylamine/trimethylamine dehydrogenase